MSPPASVGSGSPKGSKSLVFAVDLLLLSISLGVLSIAVTGGGAFTVIGIPVSVHQAGALLPLLLILGLLRALVLRGRHWPRAPLALAPATPLRRIELLWNRPSVLLWHAGRHPARCLAGLVLLSLTLKFLNVVGSQGFFSGDDVESLTESLSRVQGIPFEAWSLRNSFFPRVFLEPLPRILHALGAGTTEMIVGARLGVSLTSLLAFPLCFLLAESYRTRKTPPHLLGTLAAMLLLLNGGETQFASSCLPRPVVGVFALATAWLVRRGGPRSEALAAMALGVAAAIRFSELVLLPAAFLVLVSRKRYWSSVLVPIGALLVAASIWAVFDHLDGRPPMASLRAIVDYTLVDGASSRGFQPWHFYLVQAPKWLGVPGVLFAALAAQRRYLETWIWLVVPLVLLSFLPHKEGRYLIPYTGFAVVLAALGLSRWLTWLRGRPQARRRRPRWKSAPVLSALLLVAVMGGVDGQRFRRSDGAVLAARHVAKLQSKGNSLVQQSWKAGGPLHLGQVGRVDSLDPSKLRRGDFSELRSRLESEDYAFVVLQFQVANRPELRHELQSRGYHRVGGPWEHDNDPHALFVATSPAGSSSSAEAPPRRSPEPEP